MAGHFHACHLNNAVESLNKCSINHSKRSKTLEACLEFTYRQDKKTTLEHLYSYSWLPLSFQRKTTESCRQRALKQNKARSKRVFSAKTDEDDIGLKGKTCTDQYLNCYHVNVGLPAFHQRLVISLYLFKFLTVYQVLQWFLEKAGRGEPRVRMMILLRRKCRGRKYKGKYKFCFVCAILE